MRNLLPTVNNIKIVLFDLDNTLYDEKQYFFGVFQDIAKLLSKKFSIKPEKIENQLKKIFFIKGSLYDHLFDDLLLELGIPNNEYLIRKLIKNFHSHKPSLKLYKEVKIVLQNLKKNYFIGIITNGNVSTQKRKIESLTINKIFDEVVYTKLYGKSNEKPNKFGYLKALENLNMKPEQAIYVGDNPFIDFIGAKTVGLKTVRVLRGEFKNALVSKKLDADYKIRNLNGLTKLLNKIGKY